MAYWFGRATAPRISNARPDSAVSEIVRGMKREIHAFMEHSRSNAMLTEFIIDGLTKMEHFEISSYQVVPLDIPRHSQLCLQQTIE